MTYQEFQRLIPGTRVLTRDYDLATVLRLSRDGEHALVRTDTGWKGWEHRRKLKRL